MFKNFINNNFREQIQIQAEKFGVKGKQALDIFSLTAGTVKEILQAELKNGNYNGVVAILKSTPIQVGANLLADKIIQRLVGRLILRFGIPGGVALNIATLLVPFIIKRISRKAFKNGKVQDLLNAVGITGSVDKFNILKYQVINKFTSTKGA